MLIFNNKNLFNFLDLFFVVRHFLVVSGRCDRIRPKGSDPQHCSCVCAAAPPLVFPNRSARVGWFLGRSFFLISKSDGRLFRSAGSMATKRSKNPGFLARCPAAVRWSQRWQQQRQQASGAVTATLALPCDAERKLTSCGHIFPIIPSSQEICKNDVYKKRAFIWGKYIFFTNNL